MAGAGVYWQSITAEGSPARMEEICAAGGSALECTMASLTDNSSPCFGDASVQAMGTMRSMCTAEGRMRMMGIFLTNSTGCEAACPGAVAAFGNYMYASIDQSQRFPDDDDGRRLAGHGRDIIERHALMNVLCPMEAHVDCFIAAAACVVANDPDMTKPPMMDNCDVPMAVSVSMTLSVADPAAFVQNEASEGAVAAGIANSAGESVSAEDVQVDLSVARRLASDLRNSRRLQTAGSVNVDATILAGAPDDVAAIQTTMGSVSAADLTTNINTALTDAGVSAEVTATAPTVELAAAPASAPPLFPDDDAGTGTGTGGGDDSNYSFRATLVPGLVLVLLAQFCAV